jgi:hypothetical protein
MEASGGLGSGNATPAQTTINVKNIERLRGTVLEFMGF